jgi:hypothetical protein
MDLLSCAHAFLIDFAAALCVSLLVDWLHKHCGGPPGTNP